MGLGWARGRPGFPPDPGSHSVNLPLFPGPPSRCPRGAPADGPAARQALPSANPEPTLFLGPAPWEPPPSDRPPPFQRPELQPAAGVPRGHPDAGPPAGTVSSSVGSGVSSVSKGPHTLTSQGHDPPPPRSEVTGLTARPGRLRLGLRGAGPSWPGRARPAPPGKARERASFVPGGPSSAPACPVLRWVAPHLHYACWGEAAGVCSGQEGRSGPVCRSSPGMSS